MSTLSLYPECTPFHHELFAVSSGHTLYVEQCGNPAGVPVIFLHGGPGSGCNPAQRRFFDPAHYHIILFDQRGCGRSQPAGETQDNTTQALVADIEAIRKHLNIQRWHVFGGSWGSTLGLAYATQHPEPVISLTLRGIFLSRPHEINWFLGQVAIFFPEAWQKLLQDVPADQQEHILEYYANLVFQSDTAISIPAAIRWNAFESSIMSLHPKEDSSTIDGPTELARARVQIHYIRHLCFVDGDQLLQLAASTLRHIPATLVQGRYDMVCPPQTAWELAHAMPQAQFVMVPDAGHSAMEPGTCQALLAATEQYKTLA
ncbi:prolyl aminopeptidase Serine peptidase. MEROPS family S33 [Methylophilus rhizosphaerae]|uniref:Proline iminopeptidase n=1 Tax=Methylophilus rhizosphaerae TaxID=492660 RepID=A0A1G9CTL0_9PROT|nr:prolyl aminopeptidase [Methylophilus rhizosphaerae]SDK54959.1 prolyl aminopeptidase Serine peptidase. MEROPS family S33 [Methylophilus rhizosphaerae]